jgi:uncharacterized protein (TIGR02271 family)
MTPHVPPPVPRSPDDPRTWAGATVAGSRGELLGYLGPVYADNATGRPALATVHGTRHTALVPLEVSRFDGSTLHLPFGADTLATSPHHDPAQQLSYEEGDDLYRHYGLTPPPHPAPPDTSASAEPDRAVTAGEAGEMIRSQEQLRVGTETVVTGRLRMRKYQVTEEQSFTVPVTREEIAFDYDEIPSGLHVPDAGGPLSEDVYEVVRYEERVVITKQLVPVERVRLIRRIVTTDQTVAGQVRSELINIEQTDLPRASPQEKRDGPWTSIPS